MNRPVTWNRALRALIVACLLVAAVLFVAANFVLVEVRLVGFTVEVRLAWAVVLPASVAFAGGMLYARARCADRDARPSPRRADEE
jgi:hypothetical protein